MKSPEKVIEITERLYTHFENKLRKIFGIMRNKFKNNTER